MVMTPYGDEEVWGQDKYKTLKDAEGQSWGVASLGGAQRFNAQMTAEGMGYKSDAFQWIAISGADAARLEALDTGRTQLTSLSHLGAALAEAKGFTKQSTSSSSIRRNIPRRCRALSSWRRPTGSRITRTRRPAMSR